MLNFVAIRKGIITIPGTSVLESSREHFQICIFKIHPAGRQLLPCFSFQGFDPRFEQEVSKRGITTLKKRHLSLIRLETVHLYFVKNKIFLDFLAKTHPIFNCCYKNGAVTQ